MAIVKNDDIVGYHVNGRISCVECTSSEDAKDLKQDALILRSTIEKKEEEETVYCDDCGEQIG